MVITLIGYRGCGKSSVAGPLAKRLGWRWVDADTEIERRAGKTIRDIFAQDGEPAFRRTEHDVMADLLAESQLVLAAGGGAILDDATRRRLGQSGPVVWLKASVETLAKRIAADESTAERRPNLTSNSVTEEIADVLAQREPIYVACATLTVDAETHSPAEVVETILASLPSDLVAGDGA
jgi:shikimate kinase